MPPTTEKPSSSASTAARGTQAQSAQQASTAPKAGATSASRSPNYPTVGFQTALASGKKIYDRHQIRPITEVEAAESLGYGGLNGSSKTKLSTVKKYGILLPVGDGWKISNEAMDYFERGDEDDEVKSGLRKMALRPNIFRVMMEQFDGPSGLASDGIMRSFLMKNNFQKDAANQAIGTFRETMNFVKSLGMDAPVSAEDDDARPQEKRPVGQSTGQPAVQAEGKRANPSPNSSAVQVPEKGDGDALSASSEHIRNKYFLGGGCVAEFTITGTITASAVGRLEKHVAIMLETLREESEPAVQSVLMESHPNHQATAPNSVHDEASIEDGDEDESGDTDDGEDRLGLFDEDDDE